MPISRQRQWRIQNQYQGLNEYNLLKHTCPAGIYLSLTPGNFCLWSGVLFIQTGPYAPGILRFQVALPQQYPAVPPLILFTSDIFHPLITPLTTYTYSTSTPASKTISSGDDERLLPGGLSLRHGFPSWFGRPTEVSPSGELVFRDINLSASQPGKQEPLTSPSFKPGHRRPLSFHIPPPKEDAIDETLLHASMSEVLHYLKRVFEDETLLDDLPLDVAANPGAWYAWRAHRRKTSKVLPKLPSSSQTPPSSPGHGRSRSEYTVHSSPAPSTSQQQQKKTMADWNWDGVWLERVRKGIALSLSDAVLYGGSGEGDDLIRFLDANDTGYANFKEVWSLSDDAMT